MVYSSDGITGLRVVSSFGHAARLSQTLNNNMKAVIARVVKLSALLGSNVSSQERFAAG